MPSYLKLDAMGHAGKDAEMRYSPSGQAVTNFSLAVARKWKQGDEWKEETTWLRVTIWGDAAERANQIQKGDLVIIRDARLVVDPATGGPKTWENKNGGTGTGFEVIPAQVIRIGKIVKASESGNDDFGG